MVKFRDSDRSSWWALLEDGVGNNSLLLPVVWLDTLGVAGTANDVWIFLLKMKFYIDGCLFIQLNAGVVLYQTNWTRLDNF